MTEQVEIAFRTHISYHIAHTYGPLGHLESTNYEYANYHAAFLAELDKEINRSQEIFIKHHFEKYEGVIPVWVAIELAEFEHVVELERISFTEIGTLLSGSPRNLYLPRCTLKTSQTTNNNSQLIAS